MPFRSVAPRYTHIFQRSPFGHIIPLSNIAYSGTLADIHFYLFVHFPRSFLVNISFMAKQISYYDRNRNRHVVVVDDQIRGIGPLDQLYELRFLVKIGDEKLFHASIRASDEFLRFLYRTEQNRLKTDYNVLLDFGLLKIKAAIESGVRSDFSFDFRTDNGPSTFELWEQILMNEYAWSKIELINFNEEKYIVFNGKKHYIPDSVTRCAMGYRKSQFIPKTQKEFNDYQSGENIEEIKKVRLIRQTSNHDPVFAVFRVPTLEKRHIPNQKTLDVIGRTQDKVEELSDEEFNSIPLGKKLQLVDNWDLDTGTKEKSPVSNHQNISITGNVGQFNAGKVSQPVANTDQRHDDKKSSWPESAPVKIIFVLAAIATIVSLLILLL